MTPASEFAGAVVILLALLAITTWGVLTHGPGDAVGPFWAPILATMIVAVVTLLARAMTGL